jgi:hypothetical protein
MVRATLAAICLSIAYWIVFVTRIGPVVLLLTRTHGVHSGDSLAFPFVLLALAMAFPWHRAVESAAY